MAVEQRDNLTTIRIVFERHAGNYRVHTIDYICADAMDSDRMAFAGLLHLRRWTLRDFKDAVMGRLGGMGITGACVRFDALESSEYAQAAPDQMVA